MVKPGKWLKNLLTGKGGKEKEKCGNKSVASPVETPRPSNSLPVPKEKKRWSFRRSRATGKEYNCSEVHTTVQQVHGCLDPEIDKKKNVMTVKAISTEAVGPEVTIKHIKSMMVLTTCRKEAVEVAAAVKIQAIFRAFLARKALCALKGLVKLQALVRGRLVRKHATETLRCMQALIAIQARAREQRTKMLIKAPSALQWHQPIEKTVYLPYYEEYNDMDSSTEDSIKIVEMDKGILRRNSYSPVQIQKDERHHACLQARTPTKVLSSIEQASPTQSTLTDMSPRTYTGHFNELYFTTAENNNHTQQKSSVSIQVSGRSSLVNSRKDCSIFPSYMANTESSRAKVRSQSAPKQRPSDTFDKQISRKRASVEGRSIARTARMQRSTSHVNSTVNGYHYPNSIKLDRSNTSLISSECGSTTSTMLANIRY